MLVTEKTVRAWKHKHCEHFKRTDYTGEPYGNRRPHDSADEHDRSGEHDPTDEYS
jgi:hypothetical protein